MTHRRIMTLGFCAIQIFLLTHSLTHSHEDD